MTTLDRRLADNIRAAREAAGFTQARLAEQLGFTSFIAISRWERGAARPKPENIQALAQVLDRPLAWFYTDHEAA